MTAFVRRGACPSLAAPMQTGDGLLLRLTPPWDGWDPAAVVALAEAADRFGNGVLDITARGKLQLRGFTANTVPRFAAALAQAGLAEGPPVMAVGPLAGQDGQEIADPRPLAAQIAAALPDLAPKVSVLVDGGGALHLDGMDADIRLRAEDTRTWHLWAGTAYLGMVDAAAAFQAALMLADKLADKLAACGPDARMRDVVAATGGAATGAVALRRDLEGLARLSLPPSSRPSPRDMAEPIGVHGLRAGVALGVAGAFGTIGARTLAAFARAASASRALRPAPGRTLLAVGVPIDAMEPLQRIADELGLVTRADDPRRRIVACPGAPFCAAAEGATRPVAMRLAAHPAALPDGMLHVSGCAKGCAHPAPAPVTLVGRAGRFGLVRDGTARSDPTVWLTPHDILAELDRLT